MANEWYVATLIIKCVVEDNQTEAVLCDEQIRLVKATTPDEAYQKALDIGKSEEHSYKNENDEEVKWRFVGLATLAELDTLEDGTELKSRLFRSENPDKLVCQKDKLEVFWPDASG